MQYNTLKPKTEIDTIQIYIDYAVATSNYENYRLAAIEHRESDYHHLQMIVTNNHIIVNHCKSIGHKNHYMK